MDDVIAGRNEKPGKEPMKNRALDQGEQNIANQYRPETPVAAGERHHRGQEIGKQRQRAHQQGDALGLRRDDLLPELRHGPPNYYYGRRARSPTSSATSVNVPSGDNSRKAWFRAAANSSARAPSVSRDETDMEKARPRMSSAVKG